MSSKKKTEKIEEEVITSTGETAEEMKNEEKVVAPVEKNEEKAVISEEETEKPKKEEKKAPEEAKKSEKQAKFKVGDLVFIHKDADADLNGFKLFPQYKKYTYTVEAYDASEDVYSLRRLNLSLRLKSSLILAPSERAHDALNKKQY